MLEEKDIKKLIEAQKEVFVTKEDLEGLKEIFVTKQDLEGLIEIVATKKEMDDLKKEMRDGFYELKDQEIKPLRERMRKVENALAIE